MTKIISGAMYAALLGCGALCATSLQAASITYNLAYSNNATGHISGDPLLVTNDIPTDGTTYATVTIDDMGAAGLINFTVATSTYWVGKEDSGFGIQSFGFNLDPLGNATGLTASDVITSTLPSNWGVTFNDNQDGLGNFDVSISKTGTGNPNRQDPLVFSIDLGGNQSTTDDIFDYIADSIAGANGSFLFAVHIAGFLDQNPLDPVVGGTCITPDANNPDCNLLTSAWFGNTTVIPVPAAVWLFGSGLLGLVGVARRKKTH